MERRGGPFRLQGPPSQAGSLPGSPGRPDTKAATAGDARVVTAAANPRRIPQACGPWTGGLLVRTGASPVRPAGLDRGRGPPPAGFRRTTRSASNPAPARSTRRAPQDRFGRSPRHPIGLGPQRHLGSEAHPGNLRPRGPCGGGSPSPATTPVRREATPRMGSRAALRIARQRREQGRECCLLPPESLLAIPAHDSHGRAP